jgi:histidyl-tRNA synthetase
LCSDCQRRTETNPLRVFDCKVEGCKEVVSNAPSILDYICEDCRCHFDSVQEYLRLSGTPFTVNHRLVRGLDYYTRTTFEIQTDRLGAQNAVLGGGRYDGLSKQLGGPDHPAIGFAIGIERLVALLEEQGPPEMPVPHLFFAGIGAEAEKKVFQWAMELRKNGLWVEIDYASKGLKAQLKRADRLKAKKVLIVGDSELASGKGILRDMLAKTQGEIPLDDLASRFRNPSPLT